MKLAGPKKAANPLSLSLCRSLTLGGCGCGRAREVCGLRERESGWSNQWNRIASPNSEATRTKRVRCFGGRTTFNSARLHKHRDETRRVDTREKERPGRREDRNTRQFAGRRSETLHGHGHQRRPSLCPTKLSPASERASCLLSSRWRWP